MNKTEYIVKCLSKGTNKKYETFVLNAIYNKLNNPNLEIATQQYVATKDDKIRYMDLYFPQIKTGVEVDEPYHTAESQKLSDKKREDAIKEAILNSMMFNTERKIEIKRISVSESMEFSMLMKKIDKLVMEINEIIKKEKCPLVWNYTEEEKINQILKRGYLQRTDSFHCMNDIARFFGFKREGNSCYSCTIRLTKNIIVWSPTLSLNGSNKDGWINTLSDDLKCIYESDLKKKKKNEENYKWHFKNNSKRVTFLKYKDALGNERRRFLGVYSADSYDNEKEALVWKLESDKFPVNFNDYVINE